MSSSTTRLIVVLSVVYIDMLGIGLAFPILPRLVEQFQSATFRARRISSARWRPRTRWRSSCARRRSGRCRTGSVAGR